jgi:signal peptidase I
MKLLKNTYFLKYVSINIIIAAIISILLVKYIVSPFKIDGHSMNSVLKDKDRIIISKIAVKTHKIQRFDIVILYKPDDPKKSIIKRVIGLPGETIEINEGDIYINKKKLFQPFIDEKKDVIYQSIYLRPQKIREDQYFVIGDNRKYSRDSRNFGQVPRNYIYGKAVLRYWPFSEFGKIE